MTTCEWPSCHEAPRTRDYCVPHYKRLHHLGRIRSTLIDATPVREYLQRQVERGRSGWSLARISGVDDKAIDRIRTGVTTKVRRDTATRLLAVPLQATLAGCVRRIQALTRIGHSHATVASHAGCSLGGIKTVLSERHPYIQSCTADGITHAYRQLLEIPGTSGAAATNAAKCGYLGPWAWDGLDIDDPDVVPHPSLAVRGPRADWRAVPVDLSTYVAVRTGQRVVA